MSSKDSKVDPKIASILQLRPEAPKPPAGIYRFLIPLAGLEFFVPSLECMAQTAIGLKLLEAYTETRDAQGRVTGVVKHKNVDIIGTGVIFEPWSKPEWWKKRDEGVFVAPQVPVTYEAGQNDEG